MRQVSKNPTGFQTFNWFPKIQLVSSFNGAFTDFMNVATALVKKFPFLKMLSLKDSRMISRLVPTDENRLLCSDLD